MHTPVRYQPLEQELKPVLRYLRGKILNAGCGSRDITAFLRHHGADSVENCDQRSGGMPGMFVCDLRAIPRDAGTYDAVFSNAVLEHVASADRVMAEMCRVLKPGGHLVVCVPFLQPYHPDPKDFRRFTSEGLAELAQMHGLEVVEVLPVHSFAQTFSWILWAYLEEKRRIFWQALLWPVLFLWNRLSQKTDFALRRNANAYQIVMRKPRG